VRGITAIILAAVLASASLAAVSAKAGLAGGSFRVAGVFDRQLNDKFGILGEVGYGINSGQYDVITAGASGVFKIRDPYYIGAGAIYSSYSAPASLAIPKVDITEKTGVGLGIFAGMTRDKMYGQLGYDTRLGVIAEAGYTVRM